MMLRGVSLIVFAIVSLVGCTWLDNDDENGPPPEVKITSINDLGILESNSIISMRDGGYSIEFEGHSVWLYGDTFLSSPNEENSQLLSNTWSSTTDFDASDGISGFQERVDGVSAPTTFFPMTSEERDFNDRHKGENCIEKPCNARWAIWPGSMVVDADKNWVYVFYGKIYSEPGNFSFHSVGQSIAIWKDFNTKAERPMFQQIPQYPSLLFRDVEPAFGSAALIVESMIYVYGCDTARLVKPCHLARVPIAEVLNRAKWRYYAGNGNWSSVLHEASPVFNGNDMMSVFYNRHIDRYLAVYSLPLDTLVVFRTASSPEGPWSRPLPAFDAKSPNNSIGWVYDALAHPEYSIEEGRTIFITYTREIAQFNGEVRLVAVALEKAKDN